MSSLFAAFFGGWEIVLILAVVLILFGAKKLPELAKGLGQGIKEFKKATRYNSPPPRKIDYSEQKTLPENAESKAVPHSTEQKS
jgi:sec-independent protein translocase protein TatA